MQYANIIHDVVNLTSGTPVEPVTLQEVKDYLRLEGFLGVDESGDADTSGIVIQEPLELTLAEGATTVTSSLLTNSTIVSLTRSGTGYSQGDTVANLRFTHVGNTVTFLTVGGTGGEPVVIVYGTPQSNATNSAYYFDDNLIEELITAAREQMEAATGLHLVPKELQVYLTNEAGRMELPGPVTGTITATNSEGTSIDITTFGGNFKKLLTTGSDMILTYEAGYSELPKGLKIDILRCIANLYINRGDVKPDTVLMEVKKFSQKHNRLSWLV